MKKTILLFCTILLSITLLACNKSKSDSNIEIDIGKSTKFTKEEITNAINTVEENFQFPASTLTKIWYDEEKSNEHTGYYLNNGKGSESTIERKNVIVILSDFYVDGSGDNPVLNPNSTYNEYMWILIRDDKTSDWKIDDWGF